MAERVHRIHSLPDDSPWAGGLPPEGSTEHPLAIRALDRMLAVQRPVVLAHLRSIRIRHPHATSAEIVRILERRYLAAVTGGGAAVGATAVVPGIGTGITLALSGVETAGFLEATALFAQSVTEVHGIRVENPDRARALVMTLMLGTEGVDLVRRLAGQFAAPAGAAATRDAYWGELLTKTLPRAAFGPLLDRLKRAFIRQFAARGGAGIVGRALPFGVGAVIGGAGNHVLGRRVVTASRKAFGAPPARVPLELEPRPGARPLEAAAAVGIVRAARAIPRLTTRAGTAAVDAVGGAARRVSSARPGARRRAIDAGHDSGATAENDGAALDSGHAARDARS